MLFTFFPTHAKRHRSGDPCPLRFAALVGIAGLVLAGCGGGDSLSTGPGVSYLPGVYERSTVASFGVDVPNFRPNGDIELASNGDIYGTLSPASQVYPGALFKVAHGTNKITNVSSAAANESLSDVQIDSSGNVFALAYNNDTSVRVVEIRTGSSTQTVLGTFPPINGSSPKARLFMAANGDVIGTIFYYNGAPGSLDNRVFAIRKGSQTLSILASFPVGNTQTLLQSEIAGDSAGNVFGTTTSVDSTSSDAAIGTVWEIPQGSSSVKTLATFTFAGDLRPQDHITVDKSGNLFGTTIGASGGGQSKSGTVYEIPRSGSGYGALTTLATQQNAVSEGTVSDLVIDGSGNVYGIRDGATFGSPLTVYEVVKGSGQITDLASLNSRYDSLGTFLVDNDGNVFGGTVFDLTGATSGSLYEIVKGSGVVKVLAGEGADDLKASKYFAMNSSGSLFGIDAQGGSDGGVSLFELSPVSRSTKKQAAHGN